MAYQHARSFGEEIRAWFLLEDLQRLSGGSLLCICRSEIYSEEASEYEMLRLRVSLTLRHDGEAECESDCCCEDGTSLDAATEGKEEVLEAVFDIGIHPSYLTPIPYISVYDASGSLVSLDQLNLALEQLPAGEAIPFRFAPTSFIDAEHPLTSRPCYTLHGCGIKERIDSMTVTCSETAPGVSLLRWFSAVGPCFGMPLSPDFFTSALKRLSQH